MTDSPSRPIRWWPAIIIAVLGAAAYVRLLLSPTENQQERTFEYLLVLVVTFFLLFLWAMFFSRLTWKRKLGIVGGLVGFGLLMGALFEIESVSGDLVPILAFRWAGPETLETGSGTAAVETSPYDFPQFLGQARDGEVLGVTLARDWQTNPPREVWRRQVGDSCSGFAVVGNAAVTFEQRETSDGHEQVVVRHDLETGDVVWTHALPGSFETVIGGNGPRSTPTIHGGKVFAFGPLGTLRALDLASGSLLWQRDVAGENDVTRPEWGFASSPLVVESETGAHVVVSIGASDASLLAYDAATGEPVWQAGEDRVGYSSPVLRTLAGVEQIIIFNGASVAGHDPQTGGLLWSYPWSGDQPNVAAPMVLGEDKLLVSSGYGIGSELLQFTPPAQAMPPGTSQEASEDPGQEPGQDPSQDASQDAGTDSESDPAQVAEASAQDGGEWQVAQVWRSPRLKAKFTNPVQFEGHVYGLDDGVMTCLDPSDGSRCWKRGRYGHGQSLLVGDLIIVQAEAGEVKLLEATPEEFRELGTIDALDGKSWNPPALSGRYLLVRNGDEAVCYELPLAG